MTHGFAEASTALRGLLVDWGGVLTAPLDEVITAWARHESIDLPTYVAVMKPWFEQAASPVHELERGRLSPAQFEQQLAVALAENGVTVAADGLLARMLEGLRAVSGDMVGMLRRARGHGVRTALLSNSWGEHYPEHLWIGAFDEVVISGRVGMRKPETEIFRHTAGLIGLAPQQCVMVDDLALNIRGAVSAGLVGVLHTSYEETVAELEALFDLTLR